VKCSGKGQTLITKDRKNGTAIMATLVHNRNTFWITRFQAARLLQQHRRLAPQLLSRQLYTDAIPTTAASVFVRPPNMALTYPLQPPRQIAWAQMSAATERVIWCCDRALDQPTTITLYTDSMIVFATLVRGKGMTLRASTLLQDRYFVMYKGLNKAGHSLVARWIPSERNLADPLTRGVPANYA
jgi:hypothetical protein